MSTSRTRGIERESTRRVRVTRSYFRRWVLRKDSRLGVALPRTTAQRSKRLRTTARSRAWWRGGASCL